MSKKVKKTSSNILDKVRVLDEFKLPENQRKTVKEKAALASHMLGRSMNTSTIFDWIKKEAEYRRQAAGVYDGSSNKKPKNLRKPDTIAFGEELSKILDDYSKHTNITNQIMLDLARKLQEEKYPDLEKGGRKGKEVINLDFVRDITRKNKKNKYKLRIFVFF